MSRFMQRLHGENHEGLPQADSPGNDYARVDNFSFEDCRSSWDRDDACNAFTYNHARDVSF